MPSTCRSRSTHDECRGVMAARADIRQDGDVTQTQARPQAKRPKGATTLAIDSGGTGLNASVLDADGGKIVDRVRTKTPYPCPPRVLIRALDKLTHQLPPWHRVSVGFPGFVR